MFIERLSAAPLVNWDVGGLAEAVIGLINLIR